MSRPLALITGAGGGLGRALALELEKAGYGLVLTDISEGALEKTAGALESAPELITADLCAAEGLQALCARLEAAPGIELLINNAGIGLPGSVAALESTLLDKHLDINLRAPMHLSQAAARAMLKRGKGQIFSIASLAGLFPLKDSAAYSASKFGLRGFMAALHLELAPHGIKVGALYPNAIDTPMLQAEMAHPEGSPLNFAGNAKPLSPEETARHVMKALKNGKLETWLPVSDGIMAGLVMTWPPLLAPVFRYLEKQGLKKQKAYLASLGIARN
ncbi:SDR family NAD(P)-dependent oxidoreductase [Tepidicaulis sp.]|uniref:SDR family NAD(P)-dependent oxidoreductase n=1 Tax=Tepidicaulis sp. TaxID=1920809 RepID=UPI003B5BFF19